MFTPVVEVKQSYRKFIYINVKSTRTHEYTDTIKTFPQILQELITKGYGCGRKREIGHFIYCAFKHKHDKFQFSNKKMQFSLSVKH